MGEHEAAKKRVFMGWKRTMETCVPKKPIDAANAPVQGSTRSRSQIDRGWPCDLGFSSLVIWRFAKTKYGLPGSASLRCPYVNPREVPSDSI